MPRRRRRRRRTRSDSLEWADVPPPGDMSDVERDSEDDVDARAGVVPVEAGAGGAIEDWDDDAWN